MTPAESRAIVHELASLCRGAWSVERVQGFRRILEESRLDGRAALGALRKLLQELPPDDITPSEVIKMGRKLVIPRTSIADQRESGVPVPREAAIALLKAIRRPLERKFSLLR